MREEQIKSVDKGKKSLSKKDKAEKKQGRISKTASRFTAAVARSVENSATVDVFRKFGRLDTKTKNSWFLSKIPSRELSTRFIKPAKRRFSAAKEESTTFYALNRFGNMLLNTKLRTYGTLMLSFGIYSVVAALVLSFIELGNFYGVDFNNIIASTVITVLSFVMLFGGKKTLSGSICESRLLSFFIINVLGVNEENLNKQNDVAPMSSLPAFVFGMLLGIASMFTPVLSLIFRIIMILVGVLIFIVPEAGVVITLMALPFAHVSQMVVMAIYVWLCYIFKLLLGKRTFRLTFTDCCAILLAFTVLAVGIIFNHNGSYIAAFMRSGFILLFVLVSNLIRSREWLSRCVTGVCMSATAIGIYTIFEFAIKQVLLYVSQNVEIDEIKELLAVFETDINSTSVIFGNYHVLAVYLVIALFFIVHRYDNFNVKRSEVNSLFSFLICIIALIITKSWPAWIGFLVAFGIHAISKNKKTIIYIISLLIAGGGVAVFVPSEILRTVLDTANLNGPSFAERLGIWSSSLRLFFNNLFGIGLSGDRFTEFYNSYAVSGSKGAEHSYNLFLQTVIETGVFSFMLFAMLILLVISGYSLWSKADKRGDNFPLTTGHMAICAVISVLAHGFIDYAFYSYNLTVCFYMILGLAYACCKIMREDADGIEKKKEVIYYFESSYVGEVVDKGSQDEIHQQSAVEEKEESDGDREAE